MTAAKTLKITEMKPVPVVKDFGTFAHYIIEHNPSLVRKGHFLTKKTLYEINQLMSNPIPENTPETSGSSYPVLTLFYHAALRGSLFIKTRKLQLQHTERLTLYNQLTPTEKYFFILETFWVDTNWLELLKKPSSLMTMPKLQQIIGYLSRAPPGKVLPIKEFMIRWKTVWNVDDLLQYLSSFGLLRIVSDEGEIEKLPTYEASVTVTDLGKIFFPILYCERNITQWNIPYIRENTKKFIVFPGSRKKKRKRNVKYEPFFTPFQQFFKGELQRTLPRGEYTASTFIFKVSLSRSCWRTITVSSEHSLKDVHEAIQDAFDFDKDHLYAFFMDGIPWSWDHFYAPEDDKGPFSNQVRIGDLGLHVGQRFLYVFDFGSEWHFKVEVLEITSELGPPSPVVTEKKGKSPEQYHYPDDCEH